MTHLLLFFIFAISAVLLMVLAGDRAQQDAYYRCLHTTPTEYTKLCGYIARGEGL